MNFEHFLVNIDLWLGFGRYQKHMFKLKYLLRKNYAKNIFEIKK